MRALSLVSALVVAVLAAPVSARAIPPPDLVNIDASTSTPFAGLAIALLAFAFIVGGGAFRGFAAALKNKIGFVGQPTSCTTRFVEPG